MNAACGTGEQIVLQGLDDVASAAKYMLGAPGADGSIWLPSPEGKHLCWGSYDENWKREELRDLQGRAGPCIGFEKRLQTACQVPFR